MTRLEALQHIVERSAGKEFRVEFIKRTTGERRVMRAKFDPDKSVDPEGLRAKALKGLLAVWDCEKKAVRMIAVEGLLRIQINTTWHEVTDEQ